MRLITRPDFDGLACGAVITAMEEIESHLFVEPKWMQDGLVEIRDGDIIANLPHHPKGSLWFDHHISNEVQGFDTPIVPGRGGYRIAPSAARVVFEYYTSTYWSQEPNLRIPTPPHYAKALKLITSERFEYLLAETDKIDAGLLSPEEVLHPEGYVLISMTIDGKRTEDEPYWLKLISLLRDESLDRVLTDTDVKKHCQRILGIQGELGKLLLDRATLKGNVIFVDLRGIRDITEGNRFLLYTLFPTGNISVKITADTQRADRTAISVGYNIFNTTSKVNVGALMQKYGGGGHKVVGSCRVSNDYAEKALSEILEAVKE